MLHSKWISKPREAKLQDRIWLSPELAYDLVTLVLQFSETKPMHPSDLVEPGETYRKMTLGNLIIPKFLYVIVPCYSSI
jgi:hypothetical protein